MRNKLSHCSGLSINHASLVIIFAQTAFDELKFNSTIVTYLLPYIEETELQYQRNLLFTEF